MKWGKEGQNETPEADWGKYTKDFEANEEWWKRYEKEFWEKYENKVNLSDSEIDSLYNQLKII